MWKCSALCSSGGWDGDRDGRVERDVSKQVEVEAWVKAEGQVARIKEHSVEEA